MRSRRSHRISTQGPAAATQRRRKGPSTCWKRSLRFEASLARPRPMPVRAVATGTAYYKRQGRTGRGSRKACSDRTTSTRTTAPEPHPPPNRSEPAGRRERERPGGSVVADGDEGRIQTDPGRRVPPRCRRDLRPVRRRFALSICLSTVGFGGRGVRGVTGRSSCYLEAGQGIEEALPRFFFQKKKYYDLRFTSLIELETRLWLLMISVARVG